MTIRIVVADDHPLYRDGVVRTLDADAGIEVVGTAGSGTEAIDQTRQSMPDVLLLDISMPGGGLDALDKVRRDLPGVQVVMLTASENDSDLLRALEQGARGYVLKGVGGAELVEIIKTVAGGQTYVAPSLAARVLVTLQNRGGGEPVSRFDALTTRETEVLRLVSRGLSNKEIARELDLQEKTIKHHMTQILSKLEARNRVEAAVMAREEWGVG